MNGFPGVRNYGVVDPEDTYDVYCYAEELHGNYKPEAHGILIGCSDPVVTLATHVAPAACLGDPLWGNYGTSCPYMKFPLSQSWAYAL